ncbi:MAG TPA: TonB-dependent receptor [Usitatibacter sp.]|nr:TonB-dependent receptor [Usitatibacter sp.]
MDLRRFVVRVAGSHNPRPLLLPILVAAAAAGASGSAVGQTPPAADSSAAPRPLETVTVTGTRRREPVRDVPVQLNTIPAEDLEQSGARTLTDYLATQPGLDLKTSGGPGLGGLTIRGVSTGDATIATVGVYVDDVPFGSSTAYAIGSGTALDMGLLDLDRVEVLRGPQGTIYGASTMGGLIKYVTNEPDTGRMFGRAMLAGSTTAHGSTNNTLSAVLNVPVQSDVAGLRIAAFRDHFGGFVDATGPAAGSDVNNGNTVGGRIALVVTPMRDFRVKLSATSQEIKRESKDEVDYDAATGSPVNGDLTKKLAVREPYSVKVGVAGLELEYDMHWARLNSVSSVQKTDVANRTDATYVYGPLLAGAGLDLDQVVLDNFVSVHRQVQELRLTSPRGIVEWLAGYFYSHEKGTNDQLVTSRLAGADTGPQLAIVALPSEYTENAVFGDITWNASRDFQLTGGLRSAKNEQSFAQISDGPLAGGASNIAGQSSESVKTYLATARYALTPTSNVYARAASGYRPGGPNAVIRDPATGQPTAPPTFKSDSLWSYEGGYKAELLDRTLSVDAAIYTLRWKDLQQLFAVNGFGVIVNAGRAKVDGAEIALRYRPTRHWTLDAGYAHTDAKLTEDAPGLGNAGAPLPNSAKDSANAGATYDFQLGGYKWQAGADLRYVGDRNAGFEGSGTLPNYRLPSYTLVNLRAAVDLRVVQVALYVRNVADKRAQLDAGTNFVPLGGYAQVTPGEPRTIGLSVSGTF